MGDPKPPSPTQSVGETLNAYVKGLPAYLQATTGAIQPTEQAILDAQAKLAGPTNQLTLDQLKQFYPQLSQLGSDILGQQATAGAKTVSDVLGSSGTNVATQEQNVDKLLNPQFYANRDVASNKLNELLGSINLSGLSGGERAEVERSLNRQTAAGGNLNTPSAIQSVSNAMNFGNALNTKRTQLSQALDTASSFLPASKASINPIQDTLQGAAASATSNPTTGMFSTPSGLGQNTFNLTGNLFGAANQATQQYNQNLAARRTPFDTATTAFNTFGPQSLGGIS